MKKRLYLLIMSIFIGMCVLLFYVFYYEAKKNAIQKLNEEQMIHAKQAAQGIKEFFKTWTYILDSLSRMDEIINNNIDGQRYMWLIFESHREQIKSITRVDEKGTILYTVPYSLYTGSSILGQKHFQEILKERKPVVSNVFKAIQGFDVVALHVPILKGGIFKGTIAILIDFESLAKRFLQVIRIGETGYALLLSADGTLLYSPIHEFVGKSVFDIYKDSLSISSMVNNMLQGRKGITTYTIDRKNGQKVRSIKQYAVYMPIHIGNTFWSIAVVCSDKEVLSVLSFFRNRLILLMIIILLGGSIFLIKLEHSKKVLQNLINEMDKAKKELEKANLRLQELDKLKSMFIASMSHELRTPLNSIIGFSSILLNEWTGPLNSEQKENLSIILRSGKHLLSLINDVIDVSKIEAGVVEPEVKDFDLYDLLMEAINSIKKDIESKRIELRVNLIHQKMYTDRRRLLQCVMNLLSNALKFTEKGYIKLSVQKMRDELTPIGSSFNHPQIPPYLRGEEEGLIVISVEDTGIGIRDEDLSKLFQPFVRLESSLKRKVLGTGLGLYLTKKILKEILKGEIEVESEFGKGSIFRIKVPTVLGGYPPYPLLK